MDDLVRDAVRDVARRVLASPADRDDQVTLAESVIDLLAYVTTLEQTLNRRAVDMREFLDELERRDRRFPST